MPINPRVLLTGARGRVGQAVQSALASSWTVAGYSRHPGKGVEPLASLLEGSGSLGADALLHCAWSCVPASAEARPGLPEVEDLPLLRKIVDRLQQDPSPPLLIFLSTGAVYGPAPGRPSREDDIPNSQGAYAQGKLAGEALLKTSGLPVCILRVGNLYGLPASASDQFQGVLGRLVRCALQGQVFTRWGSDPVKDYLHNDDFFSALRAVITQRLQGTWNLGSGVGSSLSQMVSLVENDLGMQIMVQGTPAPAWDVQDNRLDISRFSQATGWFPQVTLEAGVAREVAALRAVAPPSLRPAAPPATA